MRDSTVRVPPRGWRHAANIRGVGAALLAGALLLLHAQPSSSPVLAAMQAELSRTEAKLKSQPVPPYYLSYEITETHTIRVAGAFGKIENSGESRSRRLDIDLRVGGYNLDNTREIRGEMNFPQFSTTVVPIDNDPDAIRAVIWHQTDASYKRVIDQFTKVKTNVQVKVAQDDKSADFSREAPEHYSEPIVDVQVDRAAWENRIRKYTVPFARYTNIYQATAFLTATAETRWYVNSEGTIIQTSQPGLQLFIIANTKAADGMELPRYESYFGFTEKDLPDDATVLKAVDKMIHDMEALRVAPIVDAYNWAGDSLRPRQRRLLPRNLWSSRGRTAAAS